MTNLVLLSRLSTSMALLLAAAGTVGAATLPFARDCDPIVSDTVSSPNPADAPWYLTFEQRSATGACVLADVYDNASLKSVLDVGDEVRTLRFNGYDVDFLEAGRARRPLLASNSAEAGFLSAVGTSTIALRLGDTADTYNVLSFRSAAGADSQVVVNVTFRSGNTEKLFIDGTGPFRQSRLYVFSDRIAQVEWGIDLSSDLSDFGLDSINFSTTIADPGEGPSEGGGGTVPEPSSLALLALAGGLAAFRRRRDED